MRDSLLAIAPAKGAGSHAAQAFEKTGEVGRLAEAEQLGNLVHRQARVDQIAVGLQQ
ncbi:hypothetical protein D3C77_799920 [compost metagenome]